MKTNKNVSAIMDCISIKMVFALVVILAVVNAQDPSSLNALNVLMLVILLLMDSAKEMTHALKVFSWTSNNAFLALHIAKSVEAKLSVMNVLKALVSLNWIMEESEHPIVLKNVEMAKDLNLIVMMETTLMEMDVIANARLKKDGLVWVEPQ